MKNRPYDKVADTYIHCLNKNDAEGIVALYAENATVEDPVGSTVVSGIEAIREFYSNIRGIDLKVERSGPVRIAGFEIAFPFRLFMSANGTTTKTDVIDVFRLDESGKIVSMRAFHGPQNQTVLTDKE